MNAYSAIKNITRVAAVLAFCVIMLGAYTRLTHAGLGCPDWPGCYGHLVITKAKAEDLSTFRLVKAWTEMAHRYAAGFLTSLLILLGVNAVRAQWRYFYPWKTPLFLLGLIIFQALLGMWTVTLKLLPIVVMAHLLGGIILFSGLCLYLAQLNQPKVPFYYKAYSTKLAIIVIFVQIALGGWVSANYAGIACVGFPTCNYHWIPPLYLKQAFSIATSLNNSYQGGLLTNEVRATIQWIHRLGALIVFCYFLSLASYIICNYSGRLRYCASVILLLILVQLGLGVANVWYLLPLPVAVAHNGVAALLMAATLLLHYYDVRKVNAY